MPIILQLALRSLLVKKLQKSILLLANSLLEDEKTDQRLNALAQTIDLSIQAIPIKLIRSAKRIEYTSSIAFKLSKLFEMPVMTLAQEIKTKIINIDENPNQCNYHLPLERVWENFAVDVYPAGWIHFQLNEAGVGIWLQLLVNSATGDDCLKIAQDYTSDNQLFGNFTNSFTIQYTHARCCSLLYLAHQEGFLELQNNPNDWRRTAPIVNTPSCFPWVNLEHRLQLQHPAEWRLIMQFVTTLDRLIEIASSRTNNLNREASCRLAYELSQAFQTFHAACRIWGETPKTSLELTQARLGLVAVTQGLLQVLLQRGMGLTAPFSL